MVFGSGIMVMIRESIDMVFFFTMENLLLAVLNNATTQTLPYFKLQARVY